MSNVRISEEAHEAVRSLADREGQSMQAILDKAVHLYRRARFWDELEIAARDLRQDRAAWGEELEERRAWEATLADDLGPE